jgi:hypothetical protein
MSLFTAIENAEHSTAAWIEKELLAIEKKSPTIIAVTDATLKYVGLALQIGLGAAGQTVLAGEVGTVVSDAQANLLAISATITDFGPTPTAATALAAVQTNLGTILTTDGVSSTTTATVSKAISEIGTLGAAVSTAASAIVAAGTQPPASPATA